MMTPTLRNAIVCVKTLLLFDTTPAATAELVGTGISAPTVKSARKLSLTSTEGAESVRTRERFSDAFRYAINSRVRPTNANVCPASAGGPPFATNDAVV